MYNFYIWLKELALNWTSSLGFAAGTEWLTAALVAALIFVFLRTIRWLGVKICQALEDGNRYDMFDAIGDFIARMGYGSALYIAIYFGSLFIVLPNWLEEVINSISVLVVTVYAIFALRRLMVNLFKVGYKFQKKDSEINQTAVTFFRVFVESILWILGVIFVLKGWGYDVGVLLGGLGVVGIIISFSFQNVLKDVFAFFSIYSGKAFRIGDFIKSNSEKVSGTVTEIGLRSTKMRATAGHEIVVSNRLLTDGVVENYGRIRHRTVVLDFTLALDTPAKKLDQVSDWVAAYFQKNEEADGEDNKVVLTRVFLKEVTEIGFMYEIMYTISTPDYGLFVLSREQVLLDLTAIFDKAGIKFGRNDLQFQTKVKS